MLSYLSLLGFCPMFIPTEAFTPQPISSSPVTPNASITDSSYQTLTTKLPAILNNAISISNTSWELGTLTESLLEVYNPQLTPFDWDPNSTAIPWDMLNITFNAILDYNWTGSPNSTPANLAQYLDSTTPTPLVPQPLVDGDGSLGDPMSLATAVWVLAKFAVESNEWSSTLGLRQAGEYAWAVGNQVAYLKAGNTSSNGRSCFSPPPQ